jgi:hypothetical protein
MVPQLEPRLVTLEVVLSQLELVHQTPGSNTLQQQSILLQLTPAVLCSIQCWVQGLALAADHQLAATTTLAAFNHKSSSPPFQEPPTTSKLLDTAATLDGSHFTCPSEHHVLLEPLAMMDIHALRTTPAHQLHSALE